MPIDAQSIASIGQNTADIAGSTMKAYTLADTMDRQQLSRMQLETEKRDQANLQTLSTLAKDPKYSLATPEGQNAFASEAMKLDPKLGMQVQRNIGEMQRDAVQLDVARIGLMKEQNDAWGNILAPASETIMQARKAGVPDAQIVAQVMPILKNGSETLKNVKLSNGQSLLTPEMATKIGPLMSEQDPKKFLDGVLGYANSQAESAGKLRELEKARLDREYRETEIKATGAREKREEASLEETKRHNLAVERRQAANATLKMGSPQNEDILAAAQDKGYVFPRMPPQELNARMDALRRRHPNQTPDEIAQGLVDGSMDFLAEKRTTTSFFGGKDGAKINAFNTAIDHLDVLKPAIDALQNGNIQAFNAAGNAIAEQFGGTAPTDFNAVWGIVKDELVNAITNGGGALGDRQEMLNSLSRAQSPAQLKSVINRYQELMGGKLVALQQDWTSGGKKPEEFVQKLTPAARKQFEGHAQAQENELPEKVRQQLKENEIVTFGNNQSWTLKNGKPVRVK